MLSKFEGSHSFHNFTNESVTPGSSHAMRSIHRFCCEGLVEIPVRSCFKKSSICGQELLTQNSCYTKDIRSSDKGHEVQRYVKLIVKGQSFMMHMIRKMVSLHETNLCSGLKCPKIF